MQELPSDNRASTPVSAGEQPDPSSSGRPPAGWLGVSLFAVALAGLLLRLTLRDRVPYLAAFYYATPLAVLAAMSLAAAWWLRRQRRRLAALAAVLGVVCGIWWLASTCTYHEAKPYPNSLRVLFWNVSGGTMGWGAIARFIRDAQPDIVGLVEAEDIDTDLFLKWGFRDYTVTDAEHGVLLMVKGQIWRLRSGPLRNEDWYRLYDVTVRTRPLQVLVADFNSNPLSPRGPGFEALEQVVVPLLDRPLVVMGDFNTPIDSVYFDTMRQGLSDAFETAGCGYGPTWPMPLPVLHIDHVWTSKLVTIGSARHGWTLRSDHRPVIVEVSLEKSP